MAWSGGSSSAIGLSTSNAVNSVNGDLLPTQQIAQYASHEVRNLPPGALGLAGKVVRSHEEPNGHGGTRLVIDEFEPTSIGINAVEGTT